MQADGASELAREDRTGQPETLRIVQSGKEKEGRMARTWQQGQGQTEQGNKDGTIPDSQDIAPWDRTNKAGQLGQVNLDRSAWTGEPVQNREDKPGYDSNARTAASGEHGQDLWDRTAGTGQLGEDSQDRTARTGQPGQDSWDKNAGTGQLGQDKQRIQAG